MLNGPTKAIRTFSVHKFRIFFAVNRLHLYFPIRSYVGGAPIFFKPVNQVVEKSIRHTKAKKYLYEGQTSIRTVKLPEQLERSLFKVISHGYSVKSLRHSSEDLNNKLKERRLSVEVDEIEYKASEIEDDLKNSGKLNYLSEVLDEEQFEFRQTKAQNLISRRVKSRLHHFKPIQFDTVDKCLTYCMARTAADYAVIIRVIREIQDDFVPETVLDFGSGVGSTFWACNKVWKDNVKEYFMIDSSRQMLDLSEDLIRSGDVGGDPLHRGVFFRHFIPPSTDRTFDLVVCAGTLTELGPYAQRMEAVQRLWNKTNKYLVIIESGSFNGYRSVLEARDYILRSGMEVDKKEFLDQMELRGLEMDPEMEKAFKKVSKRNTKRRVNYQQFLGMLQEKLPLDFEIPTLLSPGHVNSPCPHDFGCPKLLESKWNACNFNVNYLPISFAAKHPGEVRKDSFSYVILKKGKRNEDVEQLPRIISDVRKRGRMVSCKICTKYASIEECIATPGKCEKYAYRMAKGWKHGELLPMDLSQSDRESDVQDNIKESATGTA